MACDEEMSWSLSSLSEGRISLSNDGQVATHPHQRQEIDEEDEVSALQCRLQESSIMVRSEQNENKRRKLKSKVWDEFTKYKGEDGTDWAICGLCKEEYDGSSKKGTTHLKNHLDRCRAKIKFKGGSGDTGKSIKTRDLADINEKSVIDLIKNRFDAKGMTTFQVNQEEKESGIVVRNQQNEKKGKKLKSKVWEVFTKYKGEDGMDWAKCSICEKEFDGSSKKGTTHLKNHLERCRTKRKGGGDEDKTVTTGDSANTIVIKERSPIDQINHSIEAERFTTERCDPSILNSRKVRKEKMGERITALQQLVSPFGMTDTASVLFEAIDYIQFLHDQVAVLSIPFMKSGGAPIPHQPNSEKVKDSEGPKQDLRSRGLCLVESLKNSRPLF